MRATNDRTPLAANARRLGAIGALAALGVLGAGLAAAPADAQAARLPFFVGETLTYRVHVGRMGAVGRTTMIVDTPQTVRGTPAWVLRFAFKAKVGPIGAVDRTESWIDPVRLTSLRYHKHERHPLARHDERVELDAAAGAWTDAQGTNRALASELPLDELSFMYFVRTVPLDGDTTIRYERHFDAARNPTLVRVLGRGSVTTEAGTFRTVRVEMRVQDPRRYKGQGVIVLDLTDDHCRVPVRIESQMPVVGKAIMTLETQNHPATHHVSFVARAGGG
jgi:hypothetical protein